MLKLRTLRGLLVAGVVATGSPASLDTATAVGGAAPRCFGQTATIVGSSGQRRLEGTAGPDVIFSRWDDQYIYGRGGDDLLCGHSSIYGGSGDDRMSVRDEEAFLDFSGLYGGPGDDDLHRHESLTDDPHFELETLGGPGRDRLFGGPNLDRLSGGAGKDRIFGRGLRDDIVGGSGPDVLVGGRGRDRLKGGPGDDRLRGEGWRDVLRGGRGSDIGRGGGGDDRIQGGDGLDVAIGGPGVDSCPGTEAERCEVP